MKLFVWDKNNLSCFDNFYGTSMLCIVAESAKRAIELVKDNNKHDIYESIQRFGFYYELYKKFRSVDFVLKYPTKEDIVKNFKHHYFAKEWVTHVVPNSSYASLVESAVTLEPDFYKWRNPWIEENFVNKATGYTNNAILPVEHDLTQEVFLFSEASD